MFDVIERLANVHTYSYTEDGRRHYFFVERLWDLASRMTVVDVEVESLDLEKNVWFNRKAPTITRILQQVEKIERADLSWPIILDSRGEIMDGYHRAAKALKLGLSTIRGVRFEEDPEPDVVVRIFTGKVERTLHAEFAD